MKKFLLSMCALIVVCLTIFLFPRPAKADASVITHPEYDQETMETCSDNIWNLFSQLQGCPAMMEEVIQNPLMSELYLCASHNDCLNCASLLMFKLWQESDVWDDTLGESEPAETVVEDVVYILHEQTLLNEQLLQQ